MYIYKAKMRGREKKMESETSSFIFNAIFNFFLFLILAIAYILFIIYIVFET